MYSETLKVLRIAGRETWEAREARAAEQSHGPFGQDRQEDTGGRGRSAGGDAGADADARPPSVCLVAQHDMDGSDASATVGTAREEARTGARRPVRVLARGGGRNGGGKTRGRGSGRGRPDDHAADTRADGRLWDASE